jgi:hypothetical protein
LTVFEMLQRVLRVLRDQSVEASEVKLDVGYYDRDGLIRASSHQRVHIAQTLNQKALSVLDHPSMSD